ncbi:hypothetical protein FKM82_007771 [Ascaphus truei]
MQGDIGVLEQEEDNGVLEQQEHIGVQELQGQIGVKEQQGDIGVQEQQRDIGVQEQQGDPRLQEPCALTDPQQYAQLFTANTRPEVEDLENSIEEMMVRLDEFCGMIDMIRKETSEILEEKIPAMKFRVEEMNRIYSKIDKLEGFVKMVGHHVTFLEKEVTQAEGDNLHFPQAVHRMMQGAHMPSFLRRCSIQTSDMTMGAI